MKYLLGIVLSVAFVVFGTVTLSSYGMDQDEVFRLLRGNAFLDYAVNFGNPSMTSRPEGPIVIKPKENASRYNFSSWEFGKLVDEWQRPQMVDGTYFKSDIWTKYVLDEVTVGAPPLPEILGTISNRIFFEWLKVLPDLESYHFAYILVTAIGVFVVYAFAFDLTRSRLPAIVAGLALAAFPLFFSHAHFNPKDTLQASLFAGAVWGFWRWVQDSKCLKWLIVFGTFFTLSMGVKWQVMFLPFIFAPWLFAIRKSVEFKSWFRPSKLTTIGVVLGVTIFIFLTIISPPAWSNPIGVFLETTTYFWLIGTSSMVFQPAGFIILGGFNILPGILLVTQTPPVILGLLGVGIYSLVRGKKLVLRTEILLLFWLLIPVVRQSLPHTFFYGGVRQFMEVIPVMAIISGVGFFYLNQRFPKLIILVLLIIFIGLVAPILRYFPNENAYFNFLTGGLSGAYKNNLVDWMVTNGSVYRQGVNWINSNAPKNSKVAFLEGTMYAINPDWFRPDINFSPGNFSGYEQKGEYIIKLKPLDPPVFAARYPERFLDPVNEVLVDGQSLLAIYKNERATVLEEVEFQSQWKNLGSGDFLEITLSKEAAIGQIEMTGVRPGCFLRTSEEEFVFRNDVFNVNEIEFVSPNRVVYSFPGELATTIRIVPKSPLACAISGKVTSIREIKDE